MKALLSITLLLPLASCAASGSAVRATPPAAPAGALDAAPTAGTPVPNPPPAAPLQDGRGPRAEDWEITLGGSGSNDNDFDTGSLAWSGSAGYFFRERQEVGIRQSVSYADFGDSLWNGSTRLFYDYHIGSGAFRPVIGANFGWVYGDTVKETLAAAPEAGVKWYLTDTAFLFFLAEYQFFFEDAGDADDTFDDGSFVHTMGIGVRL
jgi:hypothetical protein